MLSLNMMRLISRRRVSLRMVAIPFCLVWAQVLAAPVDEASSASELAAKQAGSEMFHGERMGSSFGYLTGTELYRRCTDQSAAGLSYCFAYLAAVHDTVRAYENWLGFQEYCIPAQIAQADLKRVFLADARRYTFELRGQAASVVVNSLKRAYKCAEPADGAALESHTEQ